MSEVFDGIENAVIAIFKKSLHGYNTMFKKKPDEEMAGHIQKFTRTLLFGLKEANFEPQNEEQRGIFVTKVMTTLRTYDPTKLWLTNDAIEGELGKAVNIGKKPDNSLYDAIGKIKPKKII